MRGIVALNLIVLFLAGCSGNSRPIANDPLVGGGPALPKDGATARGTDQPLPAVPAPSGSTSPAALTTGGVPALDKSRDLRIGGDREDDSSRRGSVSGVSLTEPVPLKDGKAALPLQPLSPIGGGVTSVDQGLRALELKGVQGFRLERNRESGQWRCLCSIPSRQNPSFKQTYDTTAGDALSALQAVLDQVERDTR